MCTDKLQNKTLISQLMMQRVHIAGKFGGRKVWRINSFRAFGKTKFDKSIDHPIGY